MCTAQFISANVLLTAAHCVRDDNTGLFFKNFVFDLEYKAGGLLHRYGYRCAATKNGWVTAVAQNAGVDHYDYDYAMILTTERSMTGWLGVSWNWRNSGFTTATKIGYPSGLQGGQIIQVDLGPLSFTNWDENIASLVHGKPQEQGGTSGGAWIHDLAWSSGDQNKNHVISVSSHTRGGIESTIYGPYLDDGYKDLRDYTARGCQSLD